MPPSPPTTTPKYRSSRSAIASLSTTIVPNRHPKSRIRKSVAPQSSDLGNHHQSPPTTLCRMFGKGRSAKLRSGQPPSIPSNHPMSKVRKGRSAKLRSGNHHQPPPTTLCRKFEKVSLRKAPLGQPPSTPSNHPMSNVRKRTLRKAPLGQPPSTTSNHPMSKVRKGVAPQSSARATTINHLQPPYVESSEKAAPQSSARGNHHQPPPTTLCREFGKVSLRYRFAPYHHRPHRHPKIGKGVCR